MSVENMRQQVEGTRNPDDIQEEISHAREDLDSVTLECKRIQHAKMDEYLVKYQNSRQHENPSSELKEEILRSMTANNNIAIEDPTISAYVDMFLHDTGECRGKVEECQRTLHNLLKIEADLKISRIQQAVPDYVSISGSASTEERLAQCMKLMEFLVLGQQKAEERILHLESIVNSIPCYSGFSLSDAKTTGFPLRKTRFAGYSCQEAYDAGYSCQEARDAGYSCQELKRIIIK